MMPILLDHITFSAFPYLVVMSWQVWEVGNFPYSGSHTGLHATKDSQNLCPLQYN